MKNFLLLLFFFLSFEKISAQFDVKIAAEICDSLKTIKGIDSAQIIVNQAALEVSLISKAFQNLPKATMMEEKNLFNFSNVTSYKITRNLLKNCKVKPIYDSYRFSPLTSVVDFDNVFSFEQFKSLRDKIRKIRIDKSVDILVLEVDDFYPFQEITPYSFEILNNWSSGLPAEKGKIIIVFSKNLRQARISTNSVATNFIEDELVQNIIDDKIIPNFKAGNYYQGILETLNKIEEKL